MAIRIDVYIIETRRSDLQTFAATRDIELRPGLSGEELSTMLDQVSVAVKNITLCHRVRLARDAAVLDENAISIAAAHSTAHRDSKISAMSERGHGMPRQPS